MCGICGIFHNSNRTIDSQLLKRMNNALIHRGPDDEGFFIDSFIGLAMRRLSIIDLKTGHQPIPNEDESLWIICNGEIYNHQSLRSSLEGKGHKFSTLSDVEVIIHLYEDYGAGCVSQLNGMFAFAIWDSKKRRVILARDRIGIKPLHYAQLDDGLIFASEIKSLLECPQIRRNVNIKALQDYVGFEYVPGPETMYDGIFKLQPGHILSIQGNNLDIKKYWDITYNETLSHQSPEDISRELYNRLKKSVEMRLMSDVPLGAFLSGGIDSSSVVGLMTQVSDSPVKTFSIGFEDSSYNELEYAQQIATIFNTDHHVKVCNPDLQKIIPIILECIDEPLADVSLFPTYLVSLFASSKVKVVLSGDGGDELFAGYDWYCANKLEHSYRKIPVPLKKYITRSIGLIPETRKKKGIVNEVKRFIEGTDLPQDLHHVRWQYFITENERKSLFNKLNNHKEEEKTEENPVNHYFTHCSAVDSLSKEQYADIKVYLPDDILTKVDRMSMACSLEARVPFLDYTFVEYSSRIPANLKLHGYVQKYILKKSVEGLLPDRIINRKKQGFSIPMKNWLRDELHDLMLDVLSERRTKEIGFFNYDYIEKIIQQHVEGKRNNAHQIWTLMMFNIWYERYIEGKTK